MTYKKMTYKKRGKKRSFLPQVITNSFYVSCVPVHPGWPQSQAISVVSVSPAASQYGLQ
jgi:hypothetical protein